MVTQFPWQIIFTCSGSIYLISQDDNGGKWKYFPDELSTKFFVFNPILRNNAAFGAPFFFTFETIECPF